MSKLSAFLNKQKAKKNARVTGDLLDVYTLPKEESIPPSSQDNTVADSEKKKLVQEWTLEEEDVEFPQETVETQERQGIQLLSEDDIAAPRVQEGPAWAEDGKITFVPEETPAVLEETPTRVEEGGTKGGYRPPCMRSGPGSIPFKAKRIPRKANFAMGDFPDLDDFKEPELEPDVPAAELAVPVAPKVYRLSQTAPPPAVAVTKFEPPTLVPTPEGASEKQRLYWEYANSIIVDLTMPAVTALDLDEQRFKEKYVNRPYYVPTRFAPS